jgi:hypothetical protein
MQFVGVVAKYLRGKIADVPGFRNIRTTSLRLATGKGRLRLSIDGELVDLDTPLHIAAVPASLLVRGPLKQ